MLRVEALTVTARERTLVENLSLDLEDGRITCLIGPSGCGKTSVIKWLAGILPAGLAAAGKLAIDGRDISRPDPAIGYQPQGDALFPWLTIAENAALGLEVAGASRTSARARVAPLFPAFGLAGTEELFPDQLSGGMRQRVAFLRTIVRQSRFILLDEPFSALDAVTRMRMQLWFLARLEAEPRGVLMVTHDLREATEIADRVLVMAAAPGRIVADIPIETPRAARSEAALADLRQFLKSLLLEDFSS
ncbi:ABC transporter ATP-binding protein [Aquamicrobium soli]|jgi:NitT/TauT family transport system ATP-binding protein|uniref:ABC transporter ATP-binding protein n=1 Tax=Aquamicrobium soli TaxID=1811518 RepID=A0ABV7KHJ3_9HYPH